ncbi:MAG: CHAT domain-containing protein [Burkholderiaceae bacterium]
MKTTSNPTIEFLVHGRALGAVRSASGQFTVDGTSSGDRPAWLAGIPGRPKQAVEVGATGRGADSVPVLLSAEPGRDFVVLTIDNGPTLVLHPEHARDLLRSQQPDTSRPPSSDPGRPAPSDPSRPASDDSSRSASSDPSRRGPAVDGAVRVPSSLSWAAGSVPGGKTRGLVGKVIIKLIAVVTGKSFGDGAATLAAGAVTRSIDGRVDEGVYRIGAELPESFNDDASKLLRVADGKLGGNGAPVLVLVHGTFVDTPSTFGKLWRSQRAAVDRLSGRYGADGLFALDHATLGKSPIENALTLIRACAPGARLHLLTHSRGGLVAEVAARACAQGKAAKAELELFDGPDDQRAALEALYDLAARKRVRVERIVRVACPARGTLLASKRLDAYVSVLKWALELTGLPVAPELVSFLAEVAQHRRRPDELPGIEAMMPGSALVRWIHACPTPIPGDLRVLAGDIEGDSLTSWVKTLASDAFFWTDNDLVVQTRSMYGGATRVVNGAAGGGATFVLERGGQISHFSYFSDRQCVEAIAAALVEDQPPRFASIGPLSAAGNEADGRRGRNRPGGAGVRAAGPAAVPASRPAVFLLPGILGSHIAHDGKRIWFAPPFVDGLDRLTWSEATDDEFTADGAMGVYDALIERLEQKHDVIPFPFDWRRPIQDEARRLAAAIEAALDARKDSGAAVRLLAHSMGGLVARAVEIVAPQTWKRLMAHPGTRLVMLATPNGGTWAPMQVLTGDDDFGNTIAAIGSLFDDAGARRVIAGMPGLFQMQAGLLDPELRLADTARWSEMAAADRAWLERASVWHSGALGRPYYEWSAPPQPVLDKAVELRRKLDAQLGGLPTDRLVTVLGTETWTPTGFRFGTDGLEYEMRRDCGDGRIADAAAMLPGVPAWRVDRGHVDMVTATRHFAAYEELLTSGRTASLPGVEDRSRTATGAAGRNTTALRHAPDAVVWQRPSRSARPLPPPTLQKQGIDGGAPVPVSGPLDDADRLAIRVVCGDIRFTNSALLIGHYDNLNLVGAEDTVDGLLGGALKKAIQVRLYPDLPGTHRIFFNHRTDPANPWDRPRPPQVVVLGLGAEGSLRPAQLTQTVRQAVIGCGQRMAEDCAGTRSATPTTFDLCATLMGSGGTGISPGQSAQLIAQGIREANEKLRDVGWPRVRQLEVVELYLDRAAEAWRALQMLAKSQPRHFAIEWLKQGTGGLRRPADSGYRAARYDFLSAVSGMAPNGESVIQYTIDSRRARTELQAQSTQGKLLTQLVGDASSDILKNPRIGRSLFKLLVPFELEPWFGGDGAVMIEVDATTAAIPWELLDADEDGDDPERKPWAVRTKLVRRLRTPNYRLGPVDASTEDLALVVGDPDCDRSVYPVLQGARAEAREVAKTLKDQLSAEKVRELIASDETGRIGPQEVVNAMLEHSYRVIHIAGHGEPNEPDKDGKPGAKKGVVLRDGVFIGANEVRAMRKVPELVFLNCCYLGAYSAEQLAKPEFYNRSAFAAGVADELIRVGVRCVVAAGWAVDDNAAQEFATKFYQSLLGGDPFIDAVQAGRMAAWLADPKSTTWAAYQCYGDPGWKWRGDEGEAGAGEGEAMVASSLGLAMELEQLTTVIRYRRDSDGRYAKLVRRLRDDFESRWGNEGQVAEAFASAYAALGDVDEALKWYGRAMAAPDGTTSMRAALAESRMLIERVGGAHDVDTGQQQLVERIAQLEGLDAISGTAERAELLGTAYRHRARIEASRGEGRLSEQLEALSKAEHFFAKAVARSIAEENPSAQLWPAMAQLAIALRARLLARSDDSTAIEFSRWQRAESLLAERNAQAPDFDTKVGATVLALMQAVDGGQVAASASNLGEAFRSHHERLPDPVRWGRVLDEAEFFLRPWCDLPSQLAREKRAASELLRRLRGYAGRPDDATPDPLSPSEPQGVSESTTAPAATKAAAPMPGASKPGASKPGASKPGAKAGHLPANGGGNGGGEPDRRRLARGPEPAGRAGDRGRALPPRRTKAGPGRGTTKQ